MRILHITQRFWPAVGGSEIHMGELSRRLAADGHHVTVLTSDALDFELFWDPRRRRVPEAESTDSGVHVVRAPVRHLPVSQLAYPGLRRLLWLLSRMPGISHNVLAYLARVTPWTPDLWRWLETTGEQFDLVAGMTICFEPFIEAGLRFARQRRVPFVVYPLTHLGAGRQPGVDAVSSFYTMRHQVALVRQSDAVVAQTPTEQAFYAARGVPLDRIVVAGPGVTPERVCGGDGAKLRRQLNIRSPLIVSLGSMSYDKGTMHVVEAVRALWREGRDVELVLAGALLAPFRKYLDGLPATDRARLRVLGAIDDGTKRNLLAAADVFALPSRTDSFGIVYLEAWLYRKPVIGAQVWGMADVIANGEDGLLVPFGDVHALAQSLRELLDSPERRAAMGRNGEAKVRAQHTWAYKYAITRDLYARLVTTNGQQ